MLRGFTTARRVWLREEARRIEPSPRTACGRRGEPSTPGGRSASAGRTSNNAEQGALKAAPPAQPAPKLQIDARSAKAERLIGNVS